MSFFRYALCAMRFFTDMSQDINKVIYTMMRVGKYYDKKPVLQDISLSYFYGAKIGVIGLNGSGKSSLLRILAGVDKEFHRRDDPLRRTTPSGSLEQEPLLTRTSTVREVVEEAVQETVDLLNEFEQINAEVCRAHVRRRNECALERQGEVQEKLEPLDAWDLDCPAGDGHGRPALSAGGYDGQDSLGRRTKRRVALCRLLLQKPDILLLDEPTNHLDAESVAWLEHHLQQYPGTVIAVTHDRYFLDNVAGWILELDRGEGIPWKGNYSSWLEQKQEPPRQEEKARATRQKTLQRELEWIRMSPKGAPGQRQGAHHRLRRSA